ncbi:aquaporin NIP6-1-like isoform X1 [Phoenix dactylifera]|uniref:Aquaporin NIP6-1-like isoform X1 n=1 Tax=Phoenix dactylifera TaxID=42345 RepID=A0A8B7D2A6_PHODC|nr:aquaporin NIP6-1-like isoform X1 [Phoenix dactylifera]
MADIGDDELSAPANPGSPLFGGHKAGRATDGRPSLFSHRSCFPVKPWTIDDDGPSTLPTLSLVRKVGAEFIGTFILVFASTAAAIIEHQSGGAVTLFGIAAASGLAAMIVILSTGHISGAHLNPSVTIAFATFKHFSWEQVLVYIAAQLSASLCAAFTLKAIFYPILGEGVTMPSGSVGAAFVMEFIIGFNLMFVTTAVATDTRAVGELAGIAVGATVIMNSLIAGRISGASMNPARTLGPAVAANNYKAIWVYFTAPILGALTGAGAYSAVKLPKDDGTPTAQISFRR